MASVRVTLTVEVDVGRCEDDKTPDLQIAAKAARQGVENAILRDVADGFAHDWDTELSILLNDVKVTTTEIAED